ncbi:Ger(x)C family spore germination protein [Halobacillus shinanisalinarum]|uniref:Ger(X)C family spore germination protein n=1 Tax=Halobacillus shinanisalinarum TaxID=2932258 RepID=A0ABY4H3D8_9BACI|nr:Ger(x)C family spore germination protein [Halobacillus shinanisalinarum]UOQ94635.1 Ger(x)C family spore germination protein [Halobacillus shinanisalinarum]
MKHMILLLWLLSGMILLTACWDHRESGDIALVMGMGIDKTEEDNLYRVSFQIVNPGQVAGGETGQGRGTAVTTYSETGRTIFETVRKISKKVPRLLSFSHTVVLIIGEDLATEGGLPMILDFSERYYDFRSTALVLVAREGQALPILSILSPLERIPAMKIQETVQKTERVWGETPQRNINDVVQTLSSKSKGLSLGGISLVGNLTEGQTSANTKQAVPTTLVKINGLALFKDGKLKGWLDDKEARGVAWIQNKIKKTVLSSKCKKNDGTMAIEVLRSNTKIKATVKQGKPEITVAIRGEGHLEEITCPIDLTNPKLIFQLNNTFESQIEQEITTAVKIAQEQKNDVFGFGEAINRANPKAWKQMKKQWDETFADMDVQINVEFFIRGTGLRKQPLILQGN